MRDCRSQSASSSQWKHNWGFFLAIFFMNKYLLRLLPFHQIWGSRAVCGHRQSAPLQAFSRWSPASQHRCFAPWATKTRSLQDLIAKKHNAAFPRNDTNIQNRLGELPFSVTFYSTSLGRSPGSEAQAVASKHWEFNAVWGESYTQHTHRNLMQRQGKQQWRLLNAIFFFHLTTLIFYSWPFFFHTYSRTTNSISIKFSMIAISFKDLNCPISPRIFRSHALEEFTSVVPTAQTWKSMLQNSGDSRSECTLFHSILNHEFSWKAKEKAKQDQRMKHITALFGCDRCFICTGQWSIALYNIFITNDA